jgi:aminoglycoside 3-N-acetyltransferase I
MNYSCKILNSDDLDSFRELMQVFAEAFEDHDHYQSTKPTDSYLKHLLDSDKFISVVATSNNMVVGGLTAYILPKFEQERKEIYIYDLAVLTDYRRKGVATSLIEEVKKIALKIKAYVIYVQADKEDTPAIRLYESLGQKEEVYHFDIPPETKKAAKQLL